VAADLRFGHKLSLDNQVPMCYNVDTMKDEPVKRCPCGAMHFSSYEIDGVHHPVWRDDGTKQRVFTGDETFLLIKPGGYCPGCGALLNADGTCGPPALQNEHGEREYKSEKAEKLRWMSRAAIAYAKIEALLQVKVEIRDEAAYRKLRPEAIEAYLTAGGWQYMSSHRQIAQYWCWCANEGPWLLLPWKSLPIEAGTELGDQYGRIVDIVQKLARLEERSELAIYYDILEGGDER